MTWLRISGYEKNVDVTYWPYDWRRDNGETTDKFKDFLQNCAVPPMVIAHGNGGLIAFAAINETPDLVHSAILIGTPFGPGPNLFPDLENDALLPSAVMNTHAGFFACIGGSSGGQDITAEQELRNSYRLSNVKGTFDFKRELNPDDGLVQFARFIFNYSHLFLDPCV